MLVVLQVLAHCVCGSLLHQYGKTNNLRVVFALLISVVVEQECIKHRLIVFWMLETSKQKLYKCKTLHHSLQHSHLL